MEPRIWHQSYDPGVPTSLDYPTQPIDVFLTQTTQKYPDRAALLFGGMVPLVGEQHSTLTYQQLETLVNRFAAGLQQHGLQKGDRVAIYLPNCPQFVIAYYGTLRAGGIVVPCNPLYTAREVEQQLQDSGATFAVVLSMLYPNVKKIAANTPLKQIIVTNIKEYFPSVLKVLFTVAMEKKGGHRINLTGEAQAMWFQEFLAPATALPQRVAIDIYDTGALMYTGGTTGVPKGAQLTHRNLMVNPMQALSWMEGTGALANHEIMLTALPLIHSYSMGACMNLSIFGGFSQVLIPNGRDLKHVLKSIDAHRVTILPSVPAFYNAINNNADVKAGKYALRSIKFCFSAASALPLEVQTAFKELTGSRLIELYGLTEASPAVTANPMKNGGRSGTIGVALADTDAKIVDLQMEETTLAPNQTGILCINGPQVMKGYWRMPTETANVLRTHADGKVWLHTGDVAEMSDDGYIRIVDRKKDVILGSSGFNVYPRDIEERLYEHPKILEAVAIGVPPSSPNQRAKVFVVLKKGETATAEEIIAWCREGLAHYKVPKYVEFRAELPKTMVGKVLRRALVVEEEQRN